MARRDAFQSSARTVAMVIGLVGCFEEDAGGAAQDSSVQDAATLVPTDAAVTPPNVVADAAVAIPDAEESVPALDLIPETRPTRRLVEVDLSSQPEPMTRRLVPVDLPPQTPATTMDVAMVRPHRLAAGKHHTCLALPDGAVTCWGRGIEDQLGSGTVANRATATRVNELAAVAALTAGARHTCALSKSGTVSCWGNPQVGRLDDGSIDEVTRVKPFQVLPPAPVRGLRDVVDLVGGGQHTCALTKSGTVSCWGDNEESQLGIMTSTSRSYEREPVELSALLGVVGLGAGGQHTCALLRSGTVRCWGSNLAGQYDAEDADGGSVPVQVPSVRGAVELASSSEGAHSCVRTTAGTVRCWGGTPPMLALGASGITHASRIAVGRSHACVVHDDRTVSCWGDNARGQLGDGTTITRGAPVKVPGLVGAVELALGSAHSCALLSDDSVHCWGANDFGQLGDGTLVSRSSPAPVSQ